MKVEKIIKKIPALAFMLLLSPLAYGQGMTLTHEQIVNYALLGLVGFVVLLILFVLLYLLHILQLMVRDMDKQKAEQEGQVYAEAPGWWQQFSQKMTGAVPLEEEAAIELNHDYDGIKELDNHLPPWWKYLFYLTIAFSVVYIFIYHISGSLPLQAEEYERDMALAAAQKAEQAATAEVSDINESNVEYTDDPAALANGKEVFAMNCAACHKADGAGGIGPNLTDKYWLHGGSINDIYSTIKYGVPDKGMIAWEPLLSPTQMRDAASYIISLAGTNPPNAKGPQGDIYEPDQMEQ
jgi:cytochrome c oxidase cbb3-type subunit 3